MRHDFMRWPWGKGINGSPEPSRLLTGRCPRNWISGLHLNSVTAPAVKLGVGENDVYGVIFANLQERALFIWELGTQFLTVQVNLVGQTARGLASSDLNWTQFLREGNLDNL